MELNASALFVSTEPGRIFLIHTVSRSVRQVANKKSVRRFGRVVKFDLYKAPDTSCVAPSDAEGHIDDGQAQSQSARPMPASGTELNGECPSQVTRMQPGF